MTNVIKEYTVNIMEHKYPDETDIHLFVSGFIPTYAPVTCIKGKPETMGDLIEKLNNVFGVKFKVEPPSPPKEKT